MFIVYLAVIVALFLALVVLIQNPKGGGLATGFQGVAQVGGVQRTTDFLEKATWVLSILLFVLCLAAASQFSTGNAIGGSGSEAEDTEQTDDTQGGGDQQGGGDAAPAQ
ncbi:MAG: preprotein translocase subunit SecG [Flavobacteriales bacterium]